MIGFRPSRVNRQPIYGERVPGIVGYTERDQRGCEWVQDTNGKRVARILRYKPHQAPQPSANPCSGTIIQPII